MAIAAQHNVDHFEIPADRTGELKSFILRSLAGRLRKGRQRIIFWLIKKNAGFSGALAPRENPEQIPQLCLYQL
jgi:hypothetical protein